MPETSKTREDAEADWRPLLWMALSLFGFALVLAAFGPVGA